MTRKVVAVRIYNEVEYIPLILAYYLGQGLDELIFYDSGSTDGTRELLEKNTGRDKECEVRVVDTGTTFKTYREQTRYNHLIWKMLLSDYEDRLEDTVLVIVDVDEFIIGFREGPGPFYRCLSRNDHNEIVHRSVFIERYPIANWKVASKGLGDRVPYDWIEESFPYGTLQDLWGDPNYKYNIVTLDEANIERARRMLPTSGFHRWVLDGDLVLNDSHVFITNHLRALDLDFGIERFEKKIELLEEPDDWTFVHHQYVMTRLRRLAINRNGPIDLMEIDHQFYQDAIARAERFDQRKGHYNNVILGSELTDIGSSRPSDFD